MGNCSSLNTPPVGRRSTGTRSREFVPTNTGIAVPDAEPPLDQEAETHCISQRPVRSSSGILIDVGAPGVEAAHLQGTSDEGNPRPSLFDEEILEVLHLEDMTVTTTRSYIRGRNGLLLLRQEKIVKDFILKEDDEPSGQTGVTHTGNNVPGNSEREMATASTQLDSLEIVPTMLQRHPIPENPELCPWQVSKQSTCRDTEAFNMQSTSKVVKEEKKQPPRPEIQRCSICLTQYKRREDMAFLQCAHHFHKRCIRKWLKSHRLCPVCRTNVDDAGEESANQ